MENYIKCRGGEVDIKVDDRRWHLTSEEAKTVRDDEDLKQKLEIKGNRTLPPNVVVHRNRDGSFAVARFRDGVMPRGFTWPEDEKDMRR